MDDVAKQSESIVATYMKELDEAIREAKSTNELVHVSENEIVEAVIYNIKNNMHSWTCIQVTGAIAIVNEKKRIKVYPSYNNTLTLSSYDLPLNSGNLTFLEKDIRSAYMYREFMELYTKVINNFINSNRNAILNSLYE